MALIHVPSPPKSAMDPNRAVSSLLKTQIEHLFLAEKRLPLAYRSGIYVNAIQTEAEAARYIREVTEAIRRAHADAAAQRAGKAPKRKPAFDIAAVAEERPRRRSSVKAKAKKKSVRKRGSRKS